MTDPHAGFGAQGTVVPAHPRRGWLPNAVTQPQVREWLVVVLIALLSVTVFIIFRFQPARGGRSEVLKPPVLLSTQSPTTGRRGWPDSHRHAMQAFGYSGRLLPGSDPPVVCSGRATYLLGRMAFGRLVGVAAPAILLTLPWFLPAATRPPRRVGLAALFTGAVTAVIAATNRAAERGCHSHRSLVVAGVMLGAAYLVRDGASSCRSCCWSPSSTGSRPAR